MYSSTQINIEVYKSGSKDNYYWRAKSDNGRTVADGSEGYANRGDIIDAIMYVFGLNTIEGHGGEFASEPASYSSARTVGGQLQNVRITMTA